MHHNIPTQVAVAEQHLFGMKMDLDSEIVKAAMTCIKVDDPQLMSELSASVSQEHEYSSILQHFAHEMFGRSKPHASAKVESVLKAQDAVIAAVYSITEGCTADLETESDERMKVIELIMQYVPSHAMPDLGAELVEHFQRQEQEGNYVELNGSDIETLTTLTLEN